MEQAEIGIGVYSDNNIMPADSAVAKWRDTIWIASGKMGNSCNVAPYIE